MHLVLPLLILAAVAASLSGCGGGGHEFPIDAYSRPTWRSASENGSLFPLAVTDTLGRTVRLEGKPERIVSLAPKNTELLFALGAGEQTVGVTTYCNYPAEAERRMQVGGFVVGSVSLERIVSLRPDVVVSAGSIQKPIIDELERLGLPVIALAGDSLEALYSEIHLLGAITDHQREADDLVAGMQQRVERVQQEIETIPLEDRVTVFGMVWEKPLAAAGRASFIGEIIELAGGVNIIEDPAAHYPQISEEVILDRDPEVILIPSHSEALEDFRFHAAWRDLQAVQNDRVHYIDADLVSRCGPRLVDALEEIAHVLYPGHIPAASRSWQDPARPAK